MSTVPSEIFAIIGDGTRQRVEDTFVALNVSTRLDSLARTFSFELAGKGVAEIPYTTGNTCQIFIGSKVVLTGYIELINIDGSADSYTITFSGRDRLGDLVDSSIGTMSDIQAPTTLKRVCERVLNHIAGGTEPGEPVGAGTANVKSDFSITGEPVQSSQELGFLKPFQIEPYQSIAQIEVIDEIDENFPQLQQGTIGNQNVTRTYLAYDPTGRLQAFSFLKSRVPRKPFNENTDVIAPEQGTNAFEFLEGLARRQQVILSSSGEGNLLIRDLYSQREAQAGRIQHLFSGQNNNVLKYSMSYDTTGRFNLYKSETQGNPLTLGGGAVTNVSGIVHIEGQITDEQIRRGRQMVLSSEGSYGSEDNDARIKWEANVRRARGRTYTATVHGYRDDNRGLWEVGKLVRVDDDFAGVHGVMLINNVDYGITESDGSRTVLGLVEKDAYRLSLEEPKEEEFAS
jgi:prophage tail gpP-like protein